MAFADLPLTQSADEGARQSLLHSQDQGDAPRRESLTRTRIALGAAAFTTLALAAYSVSDRLISTRSAASDLVTSAHDDPQFTLPRDDPVLQALGAEVEAADESFRPNIILFTVDDMGWNDIGYSKDSDMPSATAFMNSLVEHSVKFTHYYTQPSCTPSRSTIMSGMWVHKTGYQNIEIQWDYGFGMPTKFKLMPQHMKELGYRTVGFGKWNIGHCSDSYQPHTRGFDYFFGYNCPGHGYRDFNCGWASGVRDLFEAGIKVENGEETHYWETGKPYLGEYDTKIYTEKAVEFLHSHFTNHPKERFFMWMAHHGMHGFKDSDPEPAEEMLFDSATKYLEHLRTLARNSNFLTQRLTTAAVAMSLDYSLYRLCATLHEYGALHESVIVVNSDNGGDPDYNYGHPGNNYPLRGEKFFYYEGGIRVPAFVYAPKVWSSDLIGTEYHGMLHHVDLLTTFVKLAGGNAKEENNHLDGEDFVAAVKEGKSAREELVLSLPRSGDDWKFGTSNDEVAALRMGDYKIMITSPHDYRFTPTVKASYEHFTTEYCVYGWFGISKGEYDSICSWGNRMFDIANDPTESNNLWDNEDYKEVKETMIERIYTLIHENPYEYGKRQFEIFKKNSAETSEQLYAATKARDGFAGPWGCYTLE